MKVYNHILVCCIALLVSCAGNNDMAHTSGKFTSYAKQTLDSVYSKYSVSGENLLRENYPFKEEQQVTYLNTQETRENKFAYLWPFSGTFSAVNALYFKTNDEKYLALLKNSVLPGLEEYYDTERYPFGYASYINRAPLSDRYYDDNVWIGIDFTELYLFTQDQSFLEKAKSIWNFVYSGYDENLGGGIYWVEGDNTSKNTCSNAPAVVFALKLYQATTDEDYLIKAKELYRWTKKSLQDQDDHLYYDNIKIDGSLDKTKYAYNSGQMLQSAAILYQITGESEYLNEAKALAKASHDYFFHDFKTNGVSFKMLNNGNVWFSAIMARGFLELYAIDKDVTYLNSFIQSLNYAWYHMRDHGGLFGTNWNGDKQSDEKWLLTQAAMIEMYAKFSNINIGE